MKNLWSAWVKKCVDAGLAGLTPGRAQSPSDPGAGPSATRAAALVRSPHWRSGGTDAPGRPRESASNLLPVEEGDTGGRGANARAWIEAGAAAVAALAAVIAIVVTQRSSPAPAPVGAAGQTVAAASVTPIPAGTPRSTAADEVRAFFVTDNGAGCVDILDTAETEPGRVAILGCTVARGDVKVDLSKFGSPGELAAYLARITSAAGDAGEVRAWHLGGAGTPPTGSTVEFIAKGGRATILWTYDAQGMAGMASRNDGDQAALNAWWGSIGGFVEDDVAAEVIAGG